MPGRRSWVTGLVVLLSAVVSIGGSGVAGAQPSNDDFAAARPVASLPYRDLADIQGATVEPGEPENACDQCSPFDRTIWYSFFRATDTRVVADTAGSMFPVTVHVYTGSSLEGLHAVAVDRTGSKLTFGAAAGTTYWMQAGATIVDEAVLAALHVEEEPAPANDDFSDAAAIAAIPFGAEEGTAGATHEGDEPLRCTALKPAFDKTVWFRFVPETSLTVLASTIGSDFVTNLAVYRATSLPPPPGFCNDTAVAGGPGSFLSFPALAHEVYMFQVGGQYGAFGHLVFALSAGIPGVPISYQAGCMFVEPAVHATYHELGGDPSEFDWDRDGLDDYGEIFLHQTDAQNPDTDGDGSSDGEEVCVRGSDPNDPSPSAPYRLRPGAGPVSGFVPPPGGQPVVFCAGTANLIRYGQAVDLWADGVPVSSCSASFVSAGATVSIAALSVGATGSPTIDASIQLDGVSIAQCRAGGSVPVLSCQSQTTVAIPPGTILSCVLKGGRLFAFARCSSV